MELAPFVGQRPAEFDRNLTFDWKRFELFHRRMPPFLPLFHTWAISSSLRWRSFDGYSVQ
jgi:hypothetical protein